MTRKIVDAEVQVFRPTATDAIRNHWPLNEEFGSTAHDAEGDGDGTINGALVDDIGFDNRGAYFFDGVDDYIALDTAFTDAGGILNLTVGAWVKTDMPNGQIISFDQNEYFSFRLQNDVVTLEMADKYGSTGKVSGSTAVTDNQWHFVAGVFQQGAPNDIRVYVDGSEDGATNAFGGEPAGTGITRYGFIGIGSEATEHDGAKGGTATGSSSDSELGEDDLGGSSLGTDNDDFSASYYGGHLTNVFIQTEALTEPELSDIHGSGGVATAPTFTVPATDIDKVSIHQRVRSKRDTGSIQINNNAGTYDAGKNPIRSGDRLRFRTRLDGEDQLTLRWTAVARKVERQVDAEHVETITVDAEDFAAAVLSMRYVENSFVGAPLSGTPDSVLDTIVSNEAPSVRLDLVEEVGGTYDFFFNAKNLLDAVDKVRKEGDLVFTSVGESIKAVTVSSLTQEFELDVDDHSGYTVTHNDSDMVNDIRVDGGNSHAIDDEQTDQTAYQTVTESSRLTHQLSTRKADVSKLELWTKLTGSEEDVVVRLQKDDGGSPVAIDNNESDLARTSRSFDELTDDGYTTFIFPDHTLPEPNPWLIVETDDSTGQDIGIDDNETGNPPTYKAHFSFPVSTRRKDAVSINDHRKREEHISSDAFKTLTAVSQKAIAEIDRNSEPEVEVSFEAESSRAHNLWPGDMVYFDTTNVTGEFVILEKETEYNGIQLKTDLTLIKRTTI